MREHRPYSTRCLVPGTGAGFVRSPVALSAGLPAGSWGADFCFPAFNAGRGYRDDGLAECHRSLPFPERDPGEVTLSQRASRSNITVVYHGEILRTDSSGERSAGSACVPGQPHYAAGPRAVDAGICHCCRLLCVPWCSGRLSFGGFHVQVAVRDAFQDPWRRLDMRLGRLQDRVPVGVHPCGEGWAGVCVAGVFGGGHQVLPFG